MKAKAFAALTAIGVLTGCETISDAIEENYFTTEDEIDLENTYGKAGFVKGFLGGVAGDEPAAVLLAQDVLSAGGTAADAATSMYFMMAVTMPSTSGLAGGGTCMVYNAAEGVAETLSFPNALPRTPAALGQPLIPIPGNPRGFAVLHARFGSLPWAQVIGPAEQAARFGARVSRAFGRDLTAYRAHITQSPQLTEMLRHSRSKRLLTEGDRYTLPGLAGTLGRMRARGVGEFYLGQLARKFVDEQAAIGGQLTLQDMRNYLPKWSGTLELDWRKETEFRFPLTSGGAGLAAAKAMGALTVDADYEDADPQDRVHLLSEALRLGLAEAGKGGRDNGVDAFTEERLEQLADRLRADRKGGFPTVRLAESKTGASFAVIDNKGGAVACAVSMNKPFGSGQVLPGLGMHLAAAPGVDGDGDDTLVPIMLTSTFTNKVFYAGAASGGFAGITELIRTALDTGGLGVALEDVVRSPRVYPVPGEDLLRVESGLPSDLRRALESKGHRIEVAESPARLNAVFCPNGVPDLVQICTARSDTRGSGLFINSN